MKHYPVNRKLSVVMTVRGKSNGSKLRITIFKNNDAWLVGLLIREIQTRQEME